MLDPRLSYRKALLATLFSAVALCSLVRALLEAAGENARACGALAWGAWAGAETVLLVALAGPARGVIALHRTNLEHRGTPCARRAARECLPGSRLRSPTG